MLLNNLISCPAFQSTMRCGGNRNLVKQNVRHFLVMSRKLSGNSFVAKSNLNNEKGNSNEESSRHHHQQSNNNMLTSQYGNPSGDQITSMNDYFRSNIKTNSYFANLQYSMNKMLQQQEKEKVCVEMPNSTNKPTTNSWVKSQDNSNSENDSISITSGGSDSQSDDISRSGKDDIVDKNGSGSGSDQRGHFATPKMPRYYANQNINRSAQWQSTNLSKSINFFYNQAAIDVAASKV